jgi:hypothetical protein
MRRGRGGAALVAVAVAAVAATGAVAGPALANRLRHPHDEAAFRQYVETNVGGWSDSSDPSGPQRDRDWVRAHPAQVLVAGGRACSWLAAQPRAPRIDPSGATAPDTLMRRYLDTRPPPDGLPLSEFGRSTVLAGAWTDLCWQTRQDHTSPRARRQD